MATNEIEEWSKVDASNNFTPEEGGWPEGMKRSDVNNAARADMGALRRWYDDPEWLNVTVNAAVTKQSATVISIVGDFTSPIAYFLKGTRVKITGGTPDPVYATVTADATEVIGNTFVGLVDFDGGTEVPTGPGVVRVHHSPQVRAQFKRDPITVRVSVLTDVGIQVAIDDLEAASGGIIALDPRATYVIKSTIKIGVGTTKGNVRILGRGAILQGHADLDGNEIMEINDGAAGVIDVNCILEDLIFDGNSAAMTVASAGVSLFRIGANVSFVWVRDTLFKDSFGHLVDIINGCHKVWFDGVAFKDAGENGIEMVDSANDIDQIYFQGCSFDTVANTAAIIQGSGIHFAGKVHISNCDFINLNHATSVEIGINARLKGSASPSDESGRESTIHGCRFVGTGTNARGIFLEGRDVLITACTFNLTGSGTEGIFAEGVANLTERHIITGCSFTDPNRAIRLQGSVEDCIVQGCVFESCDFSYTDEGKRNRFISNNLTNGIDGISVNSPASDPVVSNNTIDTMSDDAIVIAPGVTGAQILHNNTKNITGDNLQDGGATTDVAEIVQTVLYNPMTTDGSAAAVTTTEVFIPNSSMIGFATEPLANAARVWVLEGVINFEMDDAGAGTDDTIMHWLIKLGRDTVTPANDPEILILAFKLHEWVATDEYSVSFSGVEFTPDPATDDIYLATVRGAGTATAYDVTVKSNAAAETRFTYLRARPK